MLPLLLVISAQGAASNPLRLVLSAAGFKVYYVESLASALGVTQQWEFDAALVDAKGLGNEISDVVKGLRSRVNHLPVLVLLHSDDEEKLFKVMADGASQVLPHASSPRIIAAQLHRWVDVFRARQKEDSEPLQLGPLWLNPRRAAAAVDGVDLKLTATEFEVLLVLAAARGEVVHRNTIDNTLRFISTAERRRSADMHISRIRRKLKESGAEQVELLTIYGQGYLLRYNAEQPAGAGTPLVEWSV